MKKITKAELYEYMQKYNRENPQFENCAKVSGVIVYKQSNFNTEYSETERSYRVWNCNRGFQDGKISNSVFGDCLDDKDVGVKLTMYNWEVDYCYIEEKES